MDDKDSYKALMAFAQTYRDIMPSLNQRILNIISGDVMKDIASSVADVVKAYASVNMMTPELQKSLQSIAGYYRELPGSYDFSHIMDDSLKKTLVNMQVKTLHQLSQSVQTTMIHELTSCFVNGYYDKLVDVLNQTMASPLIKAPDIAFIKTSKLTDVLKPELKNPRGLPTSLKDLSRTREI